MTAPALRVMREAEAAALAVEARAAEALAFERAIVDSARAWASWLDWLVLLLGGRQR